MSTTRIERHIRASRQKTYAALLNPESVRVWMVPDGMTSQIHVFEPRVGGTFRISLTYDEPNAVGKSSGRTDTFHGRFDLLVPDTRVVQIVEFETADQTMTGAQTITYTLRDEDGGTALVGLHEGLPPGIHPADNEVGWAMSIDKLARLVEDPN